MIESVTIKNVATFDNLGVEIQPLKPINFIYGSNGSGKTTISKLLYSTSTLIYSHCNVKWKNDRPLKTLVYNKEFRERNFGKDTLNGVFTLGQATKEDLEVIDKKIAEKANKRNSITGFQVSLSKQQQDKAAEQEAFKEILWTKVYKKIPGVFSEALQGAKLKDTFRNKLIIEFNTNSSAVVTLEELIKQAEIIFGETPKIIPPIDSIKYDDIEEIENANIWSKKIVGKSDIDIAALIQKLNINDWVNQGRSYIHDETCPFCQQNTITASFTTKLNEYFDKSFLNDTEEVNRLKENYVKSTSKILSDLKQIELRESTTGDSKISTELFKEELEHFELSIISNIELIDAKKKETSRTIILTKTIELLNKIAHLIEIANKKIEEHNEIVRNFALKRIELVSSIWKYLADQNSVIIETYLSKIKGFDDVINLLKEKILTQEKAISDLEKEIKTLSQNVTSVQPSVDRINKILKAYGFHNFLIVPSTSKPNQYQILREDNTLAEATLSEGEVTFITFLYFLQLAEGGDNEENVTDERVVVMDDPISSLDSNILFVVSSLLKDLIRKICDRQGNIKQFILLTHNIYFHKEVTYIDGRAQLRNDYAFWILRKKDKVSSIQSFGMNNTIHNSYELLWLELKNRDKNSSITIQNTMRRIIENYFKLLGHYEDRDLIGSFENPEEKYICKSLISWYNEGSHTIPDDLFIEHQTDVTDRYYDVFKKIFQYSGHIAHFEMMMKEKALQMA